ncbi:hypothetical protein HQN90_11230 [Paenibacillus alba]|nr:hypothetical protein [Paenibacillus alba]
MKTDKSINNVIADINLQYNTTWKSNRFTKGVGLKKIVAVKDEWSESKGVGLYNLQDKTLI